MAIELREIEHEEIYRLVLEDQESLDGLKICGFLKLFMMQNMRGQTRLLNMSINY